MRKERPAVLVETEVFALELEKERIKGGYLGRFFGTGENAPRNIIGLIILVLVASGVGMFLFNSGNAVAYWELMAPIVTLGIGYLVGRQHGPAD